MFLGVLLLRQNKTFKIKTENGVSLFHNPIIKNVDGMIQIDNYSFLLSSVKSMLVDKKTGNVTLDFTGDKVESLCDSIEFAHEYASSLDW